MAAQEEVAEISAKFGEQASLKVKADHTAKKLLWAAAKKGVSLGCAECQLSMISGSG